METQRLCCGKRYGELRHGKMNERFNICCTEAPSTKVGISGQAHARFSKPGLINKKKLEKPKKSRRRGSITRWKPRSSCFSCGNASERFSAAVGKGKHKNQQQLHADSQKISDKLGLCGISMGQLTGPKVIPYRQITSYCHRWFILTSVLSKADDNIYIHPYYYLNACHLIF